MADMNQEMCFALLKAESEKQVINALRGYGVWNDEAYWRPFGDNERNWSVIGNQQSSPVSAMVEKFVNSIDAVLMRECYRRKIRPESNRAPQSITQALEEFYDIRKGNLANITASERSQLAENIGFIASGRKRSPNYTVFDSGEGQTPMEMPDTLLSLPSVSGSNKLRIPFVQGKFNMGGTGTLPFCGKHNLQLIISRRCPEIADPSDPTSESWGFTIVRRQEPVHGRRSSMFTYFAPDHSIPAFYADVIQFPDYSTGSLPYLEWGTIIKMYEYEMTGLKTNILFDLYNQISLAIPRPGLPVRFFERRDYRGHSLETTLAGLHVRLQEDKRDNVEVNFPTSHILRVSGETMRAMVYAFRKGSSEKYRKREGVIFTINGQTHGTISQRFFSSKNVNMGYIAEDLLIIVDASEISGRAREDLFMNSRDRVRNGDLYGEIEQALQELIRTHRGLRQLRERRRREAIESRLSDSKPLQEVLDEILKKSPSLSALFVTGKDLGNPLKSKMVAEDEEFEGKRFPTFFNILDKDREKTCELGRRFRVQFETDVVNDYFERDEYAGEFTLFQGSVQTRDYIVNLLSGTANLSVTLPDNVAIGDELHYLAQVHDDTLIDPFTNEFTRHVVSPSNSPGGPAGRRKPPTGSNNGNRHAPDMLNLPHVTEVRESDWLEHKFDKYSALRVIGAGDGSYDFYINMDNVYLQAELKALSRKEEPKLFEARFKYALVLVGLAMLKDIQEQQQEEDEEPDFSPEEEVKRLTRSLAPILLPMIDSLGDLSLDDIMEQESS